MSAFEVIQKLDDLESEFSSKKKKLSKLESELNQAKIELVDHKKVLMKEQNDVDKLDEARLSHVFIRLFGKMDEKIEKENLELLQAKVKYDERVNAVAQLELSISDIQHRLSFLKSEILVTREEGAKLYTEVQRRNNQLDNKIVELKSEILEVDQALQAGKDVLSVLEETKGELRSAEGWSTWDTFAGGGIISDMMKYTKMDNAQVAMNQLSQAIRIFRVELKDVSTDVPLNFIGVSMGTKTLDILFDNIFTDWSVRSKIQENIRQLDQMENQIQPIFTILKKRRTDIQNTLSEIEIN
ncbi:MAG: hypothetical protein K0R71_1938 [Bacillales bacterium]|nr:hypothetical protein [Bacillales bacterium]